VIQAEDLCVYNMHNIVEKRFSISIAPVRSQGGSLVFNKIIDFVLRINLVLIDQQSVGKRSLYLMDTVNAKKRWTTIHWRVNNLLKNSMVLRII
jgi:hypothetical protein